MEDKLQSGEPIKHQYDNLDLNPVLRNVVKWSGTL